MPAARRLFRGRCRGGATVGVALIAGMLAIGTNVGAATTYKWVDRDGQVHLSDTPPQGMPYEVIVTPDRAPAPPPQTPSRPAPPTPAAPAPPTAPTSPSDEARRDAACVDALYQVELLGQQRPVFRQAPDGTRVYLADADRPAELQRLLRERDANCSDDPAVRAAQQRRSNELMISLSRQCAEARDKLANYEDPDTHTPDDVIERQRARVEQYCRGSERLDLWLGDWIRVGTR